MENQKNNSVVNASKEEMVNKVTLFVKQQIAKWQADGVYKAIQINVECHNDEEEIFHTLYVSTIMKKVVVEGTDGMRPLSTLDVEDIANIVNAIEKGEFH